MRRSTRNVALVSLAVITFAVTGVSAAVATSAGTSGTLNRAFGNGGSVRVPNPDLGGGIVADAQGRIVVAGETVAGGTASMIVTRYRSDGLLDMSFGTGGVVTIAKSTPSALRGPSIAIGADGKLVVAGAVAGSTVVVRLLPDGALDRTFNHTGYAPAQSGVAQLVAIDGANRAVVVGDAVETPGAAAWRFTSAGQLDTTFGSGGLATLAAGRFARAVAIDASGRPVVAGDAPFIERLTTNGLPDSTFGTRGVTTFPDPVVELSAVAVQSDDRVVASGSESPGLELVDSPAVAVRVLADGTPDPSFGTHGVAAFAPAGLETAAEAINVLPGGDLLLSGIGGGDIAESFGPYGFVARLLPNGAVDRTFACNGAAWLRFSSVGSAIHSVAVGNGFAFADALTIGPANTEMGTLARLDLGVAAPSGYALASSGGTLQGFGSAPACPWSSSGQPIVALATTPSGHGAWFAATDGGVFTTGDAHFHGSTGNIHLAQPVVGIAATPTGRGYWLVAKDGGVFSFGDARFHGSTGNIHLAQPVVGIAATPTGRGYWLVAKDGGVFSFGDARYHGSTGNIHLNQPVVGIAASPTGRGYWLGASDGGVFTFGDATFHGSTGNIHLAQPVVGIARTTSGHGYWLGASDGGVFNFGDATFRGSGVPTSHIGTFVGIASTP